MILLGCQLHCHNRCTGVNKFGNIRSSTCVVVVGVSFIPVLVWLARRHPECLRWMLSRLRKGTEV